MKQSTTMKLWQPFRMALRTLIAAGIAWYGTEAVGIARGIMDTAGNDMGNVDIFADSAPESKRDAGMVDRLCLILQPAVERLKAAEARLRQAGAEDDPSLVADMAGQLQEESCRDVLSIISLLKRHNQEIAGWDIKSCRSFFEIRPATFEEQVLRPLFNDQNTPGARLEWLALAWMPLAMVYQPGTFEADTLERMGLSTVVASSDQRRAMSAFVFLLRNIDASSGKLQATPELEALSRKMEQQWVTPYDLGRMDSAQDIAEKMEEHVAWNRIRTLSKPEATEELVLEGGDYAYQVIVDRVRPFLAALAEGPSLVSLPASLNLAAPSQAADAAEILNRRKGMFALLDSERVKRKKETSAEQLYRPFLFMLAHWPPCLSPFAAEPVNSGWIRLTSLPTSGTDNPLPGETELFLLQADWWATDDGTWRWAPRYAGSRFFLQDKKKSQAVGMANAGK